MSLASYLTFARSPGCSLLWKMPQAASALRTNSAAELISTTYPFNLTAPGTRFMGWDILASTIVTYSSLLVSYTNPFYLTALDASLVGGWIFTVATVTHGRAGFITSVHFFDFAALATFFMICRIMIIAITADSLPRFLTCMYFSNPAALVAFLATGKIIVITSATDGLVIPRARRHWFYFAALETFFVRGSGVVSGSFAATVASILAGSSVFVNSSLATANNTNAFHWTTSYLSKYSWLRTSIVPSTQFKRQLSPQLSARDNPEPLLKSYFAMLANGLL